MKDLRTTIKEDFQFYHATPETVEFYKRREMVLATPTPSAGIFEKMGCSIRRFFINLRPTEYYYDRDLQRRLATCY